MDAVFDSSGNVAGSSGGNRLTAWTGQGLANLLAPSTSGIVSAGSLLPDSSALGQAVRRNLSFSYPEARAVDYARIAEEANRSNNGAAGGLAEEAYQKNLLRRANEAINQVNNNGGANDLYGQYGLDNDGLRRSRLQALTNYNNSKSVLEGLSQNEKAWLSAQGVKLPTEYKEFQYYY